MFRTTLIRFLAAAGLTLAISVLANAAHAATFTVTNASDSGAGSLRQAILASNLTPIVTDTIAFDIPGSGVHMISLASPLPPIDDAVTIDGYTQPGASPNTLAVGDDAVILIRLDGFSAGFNTSGLGICASGVTIRGLSITRFEQIGITIGADPTGAICATAPNNATITGNFIGLAPDGVTAAGQSLAGISIRAGGSGTSNHAIGGNAPALRNVISSNGISHSATGTHGIALVNAGVAGTVVAGNYIGTDASGTLDRGNFGFGVFLSLGVTGVTVGGASPNRIAYNSRGIVVAGSATGNAFAANQIFANDLLGIDLIASGTVPDGVTPNDVFDPDSGGNDLQNFPVISSATRVATGIHLSGTLPRSIVSSATFTFGVYANGACDDSGNGEGERLLGTSSVSFPMGTGAFSFDLATAEPLPVGTLITATATNSGNDTSEFSACASLDNATPLVVTNTNDSGSGSLRQVILDANAQVGGDTIMFNIPGSGVHVIAPLSPLPTISETVTIDGYTQPGAAPNQSAAANDATLLIQIDGASAGPTAAGLDICAASTVIRGLSITRFARGLDVNGSVCAVPLFGISISGNFLGLAPNGVSAGNVAGINAISTTGLEIGGTARAASNVISGNSAPGVFLGACSNTLVDGNLIGTGPNAALARPNDRGITLNASTGSRVGNRSRNLIAGNSTKGVTLVASSGNTGNQLFANDYRDNGQLGIDLGDNGVTLNDANDADSGSNNLQNFPVLSKVQDVGGALQVVGTLDVPTATNAAAYTIAVYQSAACDPLGNGEGDVFLGSESVVLSGTPTTAESFDFTLGVVPAAGGVFTATATDGAGNTSEFSSCVGITSALIFKDGFE